MESAQADRSLEIHGNYESLSHLLECVQNGAVNKAALNQILTAKIDPGSPGSAVSRTANTCATSTPAHSKPGQRFATYAASSLRSPTEQSKLTATTPAGRVEKQETPSKLRWRTEHVCKRQATMRSRTWLMPGNKGKGNGNSTNNAGKYPTANMEQLTLPNHHQKQARRLKGFAQRKMTTRATAREEHLAKKRRLDEARSTEGRAP